MGKTNSVAVRPKDKIEKYLYSLVKKTNGNFLETKYSRYFSLNGRVIRVSDHIGKNSSGVMSIILTEDNDYLLHIHSTNKIRNISYSDLKKLCKSWSFMSNMWCDLATNTFKFELDDNTPVSRETKGYYIQRIQELDSKLKGMGKIISKKDIEINALRKGQATLQAKISKLKNN